MSVNMIAASRRVSVLAALPVLSFMMWIILLKQNALYVGEPKVLPDGPDSNEQGAAKNADGVCGKPKPWHRHSRNKEPTKKREQDQEKGVTKQT